MAAGCRARELLRLGAVLAVELVLNLGDTLLRLVALDVHALAGLIWVTLAALSLGRLARTAAAEARAAIPLGA
eukprot:13291536-Alexandrium_andersonii.AAC.1